MNADVCEAVGVRQTCPRQQGGIEAAIHAATKVYGLASTDCMLQLDASKAFNKMNRELSLHNALFACPKIHNYLVNTCELSCAGRHYSKRQHRSDLLHDRKPLIDRIEGTDIKQDWFADGR